MDERAFETLAEETLRALMARLEDSLAADIDLRGGILTIEFDDGRQYVVNKHAPNRQIWLSSPVSGASHYAWDEAARAWRSTRGGAILADVLATELAQASGSDISFD